MARTPLLRSIRRLVRDTRTSQRTGVPMDELADMSRRRFLVGAAAGAGVLALPKLARAGKSQPTVAIIGGGIAGLSCALTLRDHGYASTVYEASGRLGGRMFSNTSTWAAGQVSEWCGELIDTGHHTVRNLCARYSLTLDDLHAAEPNGSTETYYLGGHSYSYAQAVADFRDMSDILAADVKDAGYPTLYNSYTPDGLELDRMSVYDWIETRVPGGHASPLGQLLDIAYAIEYGADTRVQSSLNLIYLLGYQSNSNLAVFGKSDERYHIRGGNQRLPEAIAAELGSSIVTGHSLVRLVQTAGGRYTCTFQRANGTIDVTADHVVLALPFAVLANIDTSRAGFDALKTTAISELGRGHNGKLQMQFESRAWLQIGNSNGTSYSDTGYQNTWDVSRAQPGTPGILVLYSGGSVTDGMRTTSPFATVSDRNVAADAQRGLAQLAPVFPGLAWNGRATQSLPHKSPYFGASYSYWKVGQYTKFAGYEGAAQGNVYFCGEHTSIDFQGYMEGGASTGTSVAQTLVTKLK